MSCMSLIPLSFSGQIELLHNKLWYIARIVHLRASCGVYFIVMTNARNMLSIQRTSNLWNMKDRLPCVHYIATSVPDSCQVKHCELRVYPTFNIPDSKFHGANMGPIWGRQDPGGPHVGHRNLAIWAILWCGTQHIFIFMQDTKNLMTTG